MSVYFSVIKPQSRVEGQSRAGLAEKSQQRSSKHSKLQDQYVMSYGSASLVYMPRCGAGISHIKYPQFYYPQIYPDPPVQIKKCTPFIGKISLQLLWTLFSQYIKFAPKKPFDSESSDITTMLLRNVVILVTQRHHCPTLLRILIEVIACTCYKHVTVQHLVHMLFLKNFLITPLGRTVLWEMV